MKKIILSTLLLAALEAEGYEIEIGKTINRTMATKIHRDLTLLESFKFKPDVSLATLKVMGLDKLNAETATQWLNSRVTTIVSAKTLSVFNLLVRRVVYVERENVEFPNADKTPYSAQKNSQSLQDGLEKKDAMVVMSNIGSALYYKGKTDGKEYGLKISNGLFKKADRMEVASPRTGIIMIGDGLFSKDLTINLSDEDALSNSIFRLGTFFHEARHSDGNGESLAFMHTLCPKGHDYAGMPACDENLNGPYTVGTVMMTEMLKSCEENCGEKDRQMLKIVILDSANRVLGTTHKGERSKEWDPAPEAIND